MLYASITRSAMSGCEMTRPCSACMRPLKIASHRPDCPSCSARGAYAKGGHAGQQQQQQHFSRQDPVSGDGPARQQALHWAGMTQKPQARSGYSHAKLEATHTVMPGD